MGSLSTNPQDHESNGTRWLSSMLAGSYALVWGAALVVFLYLIFFQPG